VAKTGTKTKVKKRPNSGELEKLLKRASKVAKGMNRVQVGLPSGANAYPDGTSVIMVGATHEFGVPESGIPERSFLRSTVRVGRKKYKAFWRSFGAAVAKGDETPESVLNKLGLLVAGDVQLTITQMQSPPNTAATIKRKGSSSPLEDDGHLKQSITHEVTKS
jgi:hypothetical protein